MKYRHTFVICAYKECRYLRECIESILNQTVKSVIKIVTSTPNEYILQMAEEYELPCIINEIGGISNDWNFAYKQAETPFVTIAHQDDIYLPEYTSELLGYFRKDEKPLIFFSDYAELRCEGIVKRNRLLQIKRLMLFPLKNQMFWHSKWIRRMILSFGCPICCPSVGYCRKNLPGSIFQQHFRSCEDWEAWEKLSRMDGGFVYCPKVLILHRIHGESETTSIIHDNKRSEEEYSMYRKFWPKSIARFLAYRYAKSQKSNGI